MNAQSSSAKPLLHRSPAKSGARLPSVTQATPEPTLDRDALEALAWIDSGMPDAQVSYGPDAPELTAEQAWQLRPASYQRVPAAVPALGQTDPAK